MGDWHDNVRRLPLMDREIEFAEIDPFSIHVDITFKTRAVLVDRLSRVSRKFCFCNESFFSSVMLLDRYIVAKALAQDPIKPTQLQYIGASCLWISSALYESYPGEVRDFRFAVTDETCTKNEIEKEIERCITDVILALNGDIFVLPSLYTFVRWLLPNVSSMVEVALSKPKPDEQTVEYFVMMFIHAVVFDFSLCTRYRYSDIVHVCCNLAKICANVCSLSDVDCDNNLNLHATQSDSNSVLIKTLNNKEASNKGESGVVINWTKSPCECAVVMALQTSNYDNAFTMEEFNERYLAWKPRVEKLLTLVPSDPTFPIEDTFVVHSKLVEKNTAMSTERPFAIAGKGGLDANRFDRIRKLGKGTFGTVHEVKDKLADNDKYVAVKKYANFLEYAQNIRELGVLAFANHPNVTRALHIYVDSETNVLRIIMPLGSQGNLKDYMDKKQSLFCNRQRRLFLKGLLSALNYLHGFGLMHRDVKTENIVVNMDEESVLLVDFSLARLDASVVASTEKISAMMISSDEAHWHKQQFKTVHSIYDTTDVCTLYYRPPELLLKPKKYDGFAVDVWSAGTVMGEMALGTFLLPGESETDQLFRILKFIGSPTEASWPGVTQFPGWKPYFPNYLERDDKTWDEIAKVVGVEGVSLLGRMLKCNPKDRISSEAALEHVYFRDLKVGEAKTPLSTEHCADEARPVEIILDEKKETQPSNCNDIIGIKRKINT